MVIKDKKLSFNPSFLGEERLVSCTIWLTGEKKCSLLLVDIKANCTAWNNNIIFGKNLEITKNVHCKNQVVTFN